jgi:hypothetical protein
LLAQPRYDYGYLFMSPDLQETLIPVGVLAIPRKRSKLTPDTIRKLRELSSQGATLRAMAAAVGVSHETVRTALVQTNAA